MCGLDWCNMLGVMEDMLQYREYMAQALELVRKGLPNSQIAEHLCLSPHTIKSHVHNLLRKVGATNRGEAAFLVLGGGLA